MRAGINQISRSTIMCERGYSSVRVVTQCMQPCMAICDSVHTSMHQLSDMPSAHFGICGTTAQRAPPRRPQGVRSRRGVRASSSLAGGPARIYERHGMERGFDAGGGVSVGTVLHGMRARARAAAERPAAERPSIQSSIHRPSSHPSGWACGALLRTSDQDYASVQGSLRRRPTRIRGLPLSRALRGGSTEPP